MREESFQLAYEEAGSGIPLILLHGNGEDRSYFRHQIKDLQDIRHVYALDTRGHGQSPRGTAPFNLDQFARDLEEFMDQNGIKQADLLGFSDGANIALLFALKHPDRVTKLILAGGNLDPEGMNPKDLQEIQEEYKTATGFQKELLSLMVNEPHIRPEELKKLTMPVLVTAGSEDVVLAEHTRLMAEAMPDSRLVILPGSHWNAAESPEAFNRMVRAFLED
ncbi:alpha/beta fold hydrolase [Faecalibaculum rodentium]|jgi:pimeloyl-ACP methyl ester carboxylesterase|uniref:alpha/beta fold hydrolase n=2 Tax=Faecalibaculum rodentium TaxID=1702221 RepID=UPI0023F41B1A|nr:alpha/beta hydrolase [Faecalibaculum rodentium]